MFDSSGIARVIREGLERKRTPDEIAEEIVALLEDPVWARGVGHPTRARILRLLHEKGELSPRRAVAEFNGETLSSVSYHFRKLEKLGLIEECERVPRRGAIEHVFRLA